MAEDSPAVNNDEQKPKSKLPLKAILIIVGVFFLEGGTIVGFKIAHKDKPAAATEPIEETQQSPGRFAAAPQCRAPGTRLAPFVRSIANRISDR